ncbi:MAG: DUF1343 domain-containing protein [bacterium]
MFHRMRKATEVVLVMGVIQGLLVPAGVRAQRNGRAEPEKVRPGITVLLDERTGLIQNRRVALITNQTGINEDRTSDIDLLTRDRRALKARVKLVALFSPEHGIRGTEDHPNVADEVDERTGLTIHSLYRPSTQAPADSLLRGVETIIFDLQDIGTRTWTYTGLMVYTLRAAARNKIPIVVLDRPNPITGSREEGPMLDVALANSADPEPGKPGKSYALYPAPLRHGMTMGELALFFNEELGIQANLTVVPVRGWRRAMWFDETKLPWVKPSPNLPTLTSALIYPALVAFERANVSVGRGTDIPFQRIGAPWMNGRGVADLLNDRLIPGVKFRAESFTPRAPTDGKFAEQELSGVRIIVTDRNTMNPSRVGAALLWAIAKTAPDSLKISNTGFDERFGAAGLREALLRGEDPDSVIDRELPAVTAFREKVRKYLLYH